MQHAWPSLLRGWWRVPPLAESLFIPLRQEKCPLINFLSFKLNNNFHFITQWNIFSCSRCSCPIFILTSYCLYTHVTLNLVLLTFNIYRMLCLALKYVWIVQTTPQQIFTTRWKNPHPHQNFLPHPSPHLDRRFLPYPFIAIWKIWKTLVCFTSPSRVVEIISTYFLVCQWIVTQSDT